MKRIAIHGVPRSGTTWLGTIFDSCPQVKYNNQPLFSYAFKDYLDENSSEEEIAAFFEELARSDDDFISQKLEKEKGRIPNFSKKEISHIIYKEARYHHILENLLKQDSEITLVLIVRNPLSVISSWYNAPKEFNKLAWSLIEEWKYAPSKNEGRKEEYYGYYKWKEAAYMFKRLKEKFPNRVYLINYLDLLNKTETKVRDMFDFVGLKYESQTEEFLHSSKNTDLSAEAYSVYRKKVDDKQWKENLPETIVDFIQADIKGTELEEYIHE